MIKEVKSILFDMCAEYDYFAEVCEETGRLGVSSYGVEMKAYIDIDEDKVTNIDLKVISNNQEEIDEKVSVFQKYFPDVQITLTTLKTEVILPQKEEKKELTSEEIEAIREAVTRQGTIDFSNYEDKYDKAVEEGKLEAEIYDKETIIQRMWDYLEDVESGDIKMEEYDSKLERIIKYSDENISEGENPAVNLLEKIKDKTIKGISSIKDFIKTAKKEMEDQIEYPEPEYYTDEELEALESDEEEDLTEGLYDNGSSGLLDLSTTMKGEAKDIAGLLVERRKEMAKFSKMVLEKFETKTGIKAPQSILDRLEKAGELSDSEMDEVQEDVNKFLHGNYDVEEGIVDKDDKEEEKNDFDSLDDIELDDYLLDEFEEDEELDDFFEF